MWHIFQMLVVFGVVSANIYWKITPNPYLAAIIGGVVAYGLTWLIGRAWEATRRNRLAPHQDAQGWPSSTRRYGD